MTSYDPRDEILKVLVCDLGFGIEAGKIEQKFSLYGKLKRTALKNDDGIGLGLMASKALVELNGGSISIKSLGMGLGCIVKFTMKMQLVKKLTTHNQNKI